MPLAYEPGSYANVLQELDEKAWSAL